MICDSPAGIEKGATLAMRYADLAVVVANPEVSSVRDSDRIIGLLDAKTRLAEAGEKLPKQLLLTRYDPARAARGEMMKVEDVLEILAIPLLGVVAESSDVLAASNLGAPVTLHNPTSPVAKAYVEASRRLLGEDVPLVRVEHQHPIVAERQRVQRPLLLLGIFAVPRERDRFRSELFRDFEGAVRAVGVDDVDLAEPLQ